MRNELFARWRASMPKFFRKICLVCSLVSGTALAVNTAIMAAGVDPHDWWRELFPYLVGVPAGMAFVAKFTRDYKINEFKES